MSKSAKTFTLPALSILLLTLIMGFQNCTQSKFTSKDSSTTTQKNTNGGFDGDQPNTDNGGFDGKPYVHFGKCGNQQNAVDTIVIIDAKGTTAQIQRENCVDNVAPFPNRIAEIESSALAAGMIAIMKSATVLVPQNPTSTPIYSTEILCAPNVKGSSSPSVAIWSTSNGTNSYYADLVYPPVRPGDPNVIRTIPLNGNRSGSSGETYYSSAEPFYLSITTSGFNLTYVPSPSTTAQNAGTPANYTTPANSQQINCYSDAPGFDQYLVNNILPPAPVY
ncbi:MAG: hypothetical protein ACXVA9_09245 [Bdellovibrionales bacterium]